LSAHFYLVPRLRMSGAVPLFPICAFMAHTESSSLLMFVFAGPPIAVINTLSELGYKVVCSTGEAEVVWTLQREV